MTDLGVMARQSVSDTIFVGRLRRSQAVSEFRKQIDRSKSVTSH
jgi:hypothetical protein